MCVNLKELKRKKTNNNMQPMPTQSSEILTENADYFSVTGYNTDISYGREPYLHSSSALGRNHNHRPSNDIELVNRATTVSSHNGDHQLPNGQDNFAFKF
jgi:hypothetical protein